MFAPRCSRISGTNTEISDDKIRDLIEDILDDLLQE
jgi:hypothetical protein